MRYARLSGECDVNQPLQACTAGKRPQIGLWLGLCSSYSAELLAGAGFDWLLIDGEHAPNNVQTVLGQLQAVAPYRASRWCATVERRGDHQAAAGRRRANPAYPDDSKRRTGARRGARHALSAARRARRRQRSARASRWNRVPDYLQQADEQMCVLVQIETREAVKTSTPFCRWKVDGVFIGPADLSADMGFAGNPQHPEVQHTIDDAIARIRAAGKAPGILMANKALAQRYLEAGALFVAVGWIPLLARAAEARGRIQTGGAQAPSSGVY